MFHLPTWTELQKDLSKTKKTIAAFGVTLTYIFKAVEIM